jgi:hypothetical protein
MVLQFVDAEGTVDDKDKLERLLKVKQRQEEEAIHIEDTQRLVTEISKCSTLYCIW